MTPHHNSLGLLLIPFYKRRTQEGKQLTQSQQLVSVKANMQTQGLSDWGIYLFYHWEPGERKQEFKSWLIQLLSCSIPLALVFPVSKMGITIFLPNRIK